MRYLVLALCLVGSLALISRSLPARAAVPSQVVSRQFSVPGIKGLNFRASSYLRNNPLNVRKPPVASGVFSIRLRLGSVGRLIVRTIDKNFQPPWPVLEVSMSPAAVTASSKTQRMSRTQGSLARIRRQHPAGPFGHLTVTPSPRP